MEVKLRELAAVADKQSRARAATQAADVLDQSATLLRDTIRTMASGAGWPSAAVRAVFKFSDLSADELPRTVRASLVGARKGAPPRKDLTIYREWKAGSTRRSPKAKRAAGELIGMSLATMFEFGTSKMQARPAFRRGYRAVIGTVRRRIIEGYKGIIEGFNQ